MFNQLTLGCDPEIFVKQGEDFISAFGMFTGTKAEPTPCNRGAIQVDGMALEFNIDPANSCEEFVDNISTVLSQIRDQLPNNITLDTKSTVKFTEEYLYSRCYEEVEMGCEPDYNSYTGQANEKPPMEQPMRTAGGHVHVGIGEFYDVAEHREVLNKVVKLMDIYLGVPSILIDKDDERRSMYGQAGACRYKPYGVEYRTLSNFWIQTPELMTWVYQQTKLAVDSFDNFDKIVASVPDAADIINNSDRARASQVVAQLGIKMP